MNKYLTFTQVDKKLWIGIGAVSAVMIIIFTVFATTSPFHWIQRFIIALFEIFLPGYLIVKLYLDNLKFTENPVIDKAILSFGLSFATVQTLYFIATYIRTYAFNVDEDVISSNALAIFVALLVMGVAFGVRFYQEKKKEKSTAEGTGAN